MDIRSYCDSQHATPGLRPVVPRSVTHPCAQSVGRALVWSADIPTVASAWAAGFTIGFVLILLMG